MKIQCPTCRKTVPPEQINMGTDLGFCPNCGEAFKLSQNVALGSFDRGLLREPPAGAWLWKNSRETVVGATTRSWIAFFLVPFMCVWTGGSLGGIYGSQIAKGQFDLVSSLFGIPFILGSVLFWSLALMAIWGKVEVTVGQRSSVFVGIGPIGWRRQIDWSAVHTIREADSRVHYSGGYGTAIVLEGMERVTFGSGLSENRRYFLVNALKCMKADGSGFPARTY